MEHDSLVPIVLQFTLNVQKEKTFEPQNHASIGEIMWDDFSKFEQQNNGLNITQYCIYECISMSNVHTVFGMLTLIF